MGEVTCVGHDTVVDVDDACFTEASDVGADVSAFVFASEIKQRCRHVL